MTFSALSYLVWYKKHRQFVKDLLDNDDFSAAQTMIESLIAEQPYAGELAHLQHALHHLTYTKEGEFHGVTASSPPQLKFRLTRILQYDPDP
jgi:hypothetical protein